MKFVILPSARDDLAAGFHFYENQQTGLGQFFLESLFADIESLRSGAGHHRKVFGYHRLLAKKFCGAIYYSTTGAEVCIHAVLDCRRNPGWIRRRLKA